MDAHPVTRLAPYSGLNSSNREPSTTRASTSRGSKGTLGSAEATPRSSSGSWTGSSAGWRGPEEDLRALLDHHDVVAHARDVGTAGGRVAEDQRHGGQGGSRVSGEVPEGPAPGDEQLRL